MFPDKHPKHKDQSAYKIIIIGDTNVGKTSIFHHFIEGTPLTETQIITTIDLRYKTINLHDKKIKLCIWDTAGQEKFRSLISSYFNGAHGVLMVFDLSNPKSFESIKGEWHQLAERKSPTAVKLLIGNKSDLQHSVSAEEIYEWCKIESIFYIETSALSGLHIKQSFFTLASMIDAHRSNYLTHISDKVSKQNEKIEYYSVVLEQTKQTKNAMESEYQTPIKKFSSAKTIYQNFVNQNQHRFTLKLQNEIACYRLRC